MRKYELQNSASKEVDDATSRKKVTRGALVSITRGAGPYATNSHAMGNTLAVAQVPRCATGKKLSMAHHCIMRHG